MSLCDEYYCEHSSDNFSVGVRGSCHLCAQAKRIEVLENMLATEQARRAEADRKLKDLLAEYDRLAEGE